MVLGIDIGTTSVAGVAVGNDGRVVASATVAHQADRDARRYGGPVMAAYGAALYKMSLHM